MFNIGDKVVITGDLKCTDRSGHCGYTRSMQSYKDSKTVLTIGGTHIKTECPRYFLKGANFWICGTDLSLAKPSGLKLFVKLQEVLSNG